LSFFKTGGIALSTECNGVQESRLYGESPAKSADENIAASGRRSRLLIILAFVAVYFIWGSTFLGIKYAIETLPPLLMAGTRFLLAGSVLYAWAKLTGNAGDSKSLRLIHWRTAFLVGALLLLCGNGGVTVAERHISSGLAALLVATEPLWIVLLNWAAPGGKRPNIKVVSGLVLGFIGIWLLVGGAIGAGGSIVSSLLVIGAGFAWAAGSIYSPRAPSVSSPVLASGMQMLAGGVLLLLVGLFSGEYGNLDASKVSWVSAGALLYLTIFGSIVAYTAYGYLLRHVSPAKVATYAYVNPVVAVILGWALAGEPLTSRMVIAAVIILASVLLITAFGKRSETSQS
jgi:drug/metabolite transporter (DMT)-like permease